MICGACLENKSIDHIGKREVIIFYEKQMMEKKYIYICFYL